MTQKLIRLALALLLTGLSWQAAPAPRLANAEQASTPFTAYLPWLGNSHATPAPPSPTPKPANMPRYVILLIGDGMGFEHVRAAGMYLHGKAGTLSFEAFPYRGEFITASASSGATDSAAGTAYATGVHVYNGTISIAIPGDGRELYTLLEDARDQGKSTGLVTTAIIADATPAAFGAHDADRYAWSAIAGDMLHQTRPNVLLGGGGYGISPEMAQAAGYTVVTDSASLAAAGPAVTRISGQFGSGNLPYALDGLGSLPHLADMAGKALAILQNDPDGFFLMIENDLIDSASHEHDIARMIGEVDEFDRTVQVVSAWAESHPGALVIVAADHECGGLKVVKNRGAGVYPSVTWSTDHHTEKNVPVYAFGDNAALVTGVIPNIELVEIVHGTR